MTHAVLKKKRLDLRSPSKKRAKPPIPKVRWIVGADFLAVLPEARRLLAKACEPGKAGRPKARRPLPLHEAR